MRLAAAYPARTAFAAIAAGVTLGVMVNALALQDGTHPNPLFGGGKIQAPASGRSAGRPSRVVTEPPPAAQLSVQARAPQGQVQGQGQGHGQGQGQDLIAAQLAAGAGASPASGATGQPLPAGDAIGDLLRQQFAPLPPPRPAAVGAVAGASLAPPARPEASPQVLAAQIALNRLGFGPLGADGLMGPGTRAAIERFEQAQGLPVTGELGARTVRALSAAAPSR